MGKLRDSKLVENTGFKHLKNEGLLCFAVPRNARGLKVLDRTPVATAQLVILSLISLTMYVLMSFYAAIDTCIVLLGLSN